MSRATVHEYAFPLHGLHRICVSIIGTNRCPAQIRTNRLGHAGIYTTLNTYTHVVQDTPAEVAKKLAYWKLTTN